MVGKKSDQLWGKSGKLKGKKTNSFQSPTLPWHPGRSLGALCLPGLLVLVAWPRPASQVTDPPDETCSPQTPKVIRSTRRR